MALVVHRPARRRLGKVPRVAGLAETLVLALAITVTLLATLLLAGDNALSPERSTVKVGSSDTGSTVQLRAGDTLQVSLEANPSTGYAWEIADCDTAVLRPRENQEFVAGGPMLGSGGTAITSFDVVGTGNTVLKMIYRRPFESGAPPLRTFELRAVVSK